MTRTPTSVLVWAVLLNLCAAASAAVLFGFGAQMPSWWKVLLLAVVAGVAERQAVRVSTNVEMTVSFLSVCVHSRAFGPAAAFVVGAASNLAVLQASVYAVGCLHAARALTGAMTGAVRPWHLHPLTTTGSAQSFSPLRSPASSTLRADIFFNTTTLITRRSASPSSFINAAAPFLLLALPLYVPVVALMVYGYRNYSFWMAATFLVPAVALQRLVHLYQEQREASHALSEANHRLEQASLSFAAGLVATLDARDLYTAGHSAAVAIYARDIAERLGLTVRAATCASCWPR